MLVSEPFEGKHTVKPLTSQCVGAGAAAREAIRRVREAGGRVCAFFSESILSCGGQVVLPPGYLQVGLSQRFHTIHSHGEKDCMIVLGLGDFLGDQAALAAPVAQ